MIQIIYPNGNDQVPEQKGPPTLEQMQTWVDGYVELLPNPPVRGAQWYANEDGRMRQLPVNKRAAGWYGQPLFGNVVILTEQHRWK